MSILQLLVLHLVREGKGAQENLFCFSLANNTILARQERKAKSDQMSLLVVESVFGISFVNKMKD